jgi:hypothetical protein
MRRNERGGVGGKGGRVGGWEEEEEGRGKEEGRGGEEGRTCKDEAREETKHGTAGNVNHAPINKGEMRRW